MRRKIKKVQSTIGYRADGQAIKKAFYGRTKEAAKAVAEAYRQEHGMPQKALDIYTFAGWAKQWLLLYKKPFVSRAAYTTTYESTVYKHLLPTLGDKYLLDITPADIQALYLTKTTLSASMCAKVRMCVMGIFDTAVHNDLCTRNPAKFCRLESIATKHGKEVYSDAEIESASRWFIRRMPEVVLLLETGVRRGELLGWHKDDFSRRKNTWTVSRAVHLVPGKGPCEGPPKCHSGRTAPLSPRGRQAVEILLQMYPDSPMLIPGPTGGIMRPDTWSRRLKAEMARMAEQQPDMPQLTAHELRHTYGTFLRRHGADIYSISKILGHKDVNVTARIYVHNEMDELRRALKFLRKQTLLAV